jgi:hypothetical protein
MVICIVVSLLDEGLLFIITHITLVIAEYGGANDKKQRYCSRNNQRNHQEPKSREYSLCDVKLVVVRA